MALKIELLGLRYFGEQGPMAIVEINGRRQLHLRDGISDLIRQLQTQGQDTQPLEKILCLMQAHAHSDLQDLSENDFSGQGTLFE